MCSALKTFLRSSNGVTQFFLFIYLWGGGGYEWGGDGLGSWFWRVSVHPSGVVEFGDSCQLKHIVRVLIGGSQVPAHSVPQIPPTLCFKL